MIEGYIYCLREDPLIIRKYVDKDSDLGHNASMIMPVTLSTDFSRTS